MWVEAEFKVPKDIASWKTLADSKKSTFEKVLAGLAGLDTHQADDDAPLVILHTTDLRKRTVYSFIATIEQIHAKSYSRIFATLLSSNETDCLLDTWVIEEPYLEYKSDGIAENCHKLWDKEASVYDQYIAHVSSMPLKTSLFYSGSYHPLYLVGQGEMTTSDEIIYKVPLDESVHGVLTGLDAQSLRNKLPESEEQKADQGMYKLLNEPYDNKVPHTHSLYDDIGLIGDISNYAQYNGNKALPDLGFGPYSEEGESNPIIENALDISTKNHDFFPVRGDGYTLVLNVEPLCDEDSVFDN